jgi:hypothetical protein
VLSTRIALRWNLNHAEPGVGHSVLCYCKFAFRIPFNATPSGNFGLFHVTTNAFEMFTIRMFHVHDSEDFNGWPSTQQNAFTITITIVGLIVFIGDRMTTQPMEMVTTNSTRLIREVTTWMH